MKLLLHMFALFQILQTNCILAAVPDVDPVACRINPQDPSKVAYTITVSKTGAPNFTTVQDAVNSIPANNDQWVKIALAPGIYIEQVKIQNKQCIVLEGQDRTTTTISFDAHSDTEQSITFDAYTPNFVARGVTFKNSYVNLLNNSAPAVAFRAYGDKHAFFNCGFEGYQDTLWDDVGRHYYSSCYIEGAIDFIWGEGASIYENASINVIGDGFITAQGKQIPNERSGYVFTGCIVYGTGHTFLGRAYRRYATVIYWGCNFSANIDPSGWDAWGQPVSDLTFAEVGCIGAGAEGSSRVQWRKQLQPSDLAAYTKQAYIDQDGWVENLP